MIVALLQFQTFLGLVAEAQPSEKFSYSLAASEGGILKKGQTFELKNFFSTLVSKVKVDSY